MGIIKELSIEQSNEETRKRIMLYANEMYDRYIAYGNVGGKVAALKRVRDDIVSLMRIDAMYTSELIKHMIAFHTVRYAVDFAKALADGMRDACAIVNVDPDEWQWVCEYNPTYGGDIKED